MSVLIKLTGSDSERDLTGNQYAGVLEITVGNPTYVLQVWRWVGKQ